MRKALNLLFVAVSLPGVAWGQTVNVSPADSQFTQNYGVDGINLQNLAINVTVPVISKPGAMPFVYALNGTNGCQGVIVTNQPVAECGFVNSSPNRVQLPGHSDDGFWTLYWGKATNGTCAADGKGTSTYSNFYLSSPAGATYYLPQSDYVVEESAGGTACLRSLTDYTTVGGFNVGINTDATLASLTFPNGSVVNMSTGAITDTFGNTLSKTGAGVYTDTLGTNTFAVTASSGSTGEIDQYEDSGGTNRQIKQILTASETILTTFGCSQYTNYNQTLAVTTEVDYPDGYNLYFQYEPSGGGISGRLSQITLRTGGIVKYSYGSINCASMISSSLTRTDADGATVFTFALSGSHGTTTTVIDPGKNKTVYTFQGTDANGLPVIGTPLTLTQVQVWQNIGTVTSPAYPTSPTRTALYCYNNNTTNCATTQASYPITAKDVYVTPDGKTSSSRTKYTYDTFSCSSGTCSYENVIEIDRYPFTTVGTGTIDNKTVITYGSWNGSTCVAVGSSIFNLPCEVKTTAGTNTLSDARYTYSSKGFRTQAQNWTGSTWLTSSATPNPNGTVASSTDPNTQLTNYTYAPTGSGGCNALLLTGTSMTVNPGTTTLTTGKTWDCNMGKLLTSTDANSNQSTFTYDLLGRPASQEDPLLYTLSETYPTATTEHTTDSTYFTTINTVDGLARPIRSLRTDGTNYDTVTTSYGFTANSNTQFEIQSSQPCVVAINVDCTKNHFQDIDELGRTYITKTTSNETAIHNFTQNDVSDQSTPAPSGENNKIVQTEYDGLGRVSSVCALENTGGISCGQFDGNAGILTSYSYSYAPGQVTVTATRGSQIHTTVYDAMGRVTKTIIPEGGTTLYFWDAEPAACGGYSTLGDLGGFQRADGVYVCYGYDGLHRLLGYDNTADTKCGGFVYDSPSNPPAGVTILNGKGRIVEAYTNSACDGHGSIVTDEWFSYDDDGRTIEVWEKTPNSGGYYQTAAGYALNGALTSITGVPGNSTYTITLDSNGRPDSSKYGTTVVASNVNYNGAGQATEIDYEGSDKDTYGYDSNTGSMNSWGFAVGSTTETATLTWNANRTLKTLAITDGFNAGGTQTCHFNPTDSAGTGYDDVGRLVGENCGAPDSHTYTYDQYDNFSKSGTTNWNPGYSTSNNQMLSPAAYDPNGRVLYDLNNQYSWDAYGKMSLVNGSAGVYSFTYDAFGRAVEKNAGGTITEMLYSPIGLTAIMSGITTNHFRVPVPGGSLMDATTGANLLFHLDWLGSTRIISNLTGHTVAADIAYTPYGENYASFGSAGWLAFVDFTGDFQNLYSGLYDTPAREFDVTSGSRWLSPDPAQASWNAYSYPTNPNSFIDSSGLNSINEFNSKDPVNLTVCHSKGKTCKIALKSPWDWGWPSPSSTGIFAQGSLWESSFLWGGPGGGALDQQILAGSSNDFINGVPIGKTLIYENITNPSTGAFLGSFENFFSSEPNPYLTGATDAAGIAGLIAREKVAKPIGRVGAAVSILNDPSLKNILMNLVGFVPGVEAPVAVTGTFLDGFDYKMNNETNPEFSGDHKNAIPTTVYDENGNGMANPDLAPCGGWC